MVTVSWEFWSRATQVGPVRGLQKGRGETGQHIGSAIGQRHPGA